MPNCRTLWQMCNGSPPILYRLAVSASFSMAGLSTSPPNIFASVCPSVLDSVLTVSKRITCEAVSYRKRDNAGRTTCDLQF